MFELILLIILVICYGIYNLRRFIQKQVVKEETYWQDQRRFGKPIAYKIYNAIKTFLLICIIAAIVYIFIALAYGGCPTLNDLTTAKFQEIILGAGIIWLPQIGIMALYRLLKRRQT